MILFACKVALFSIVAQVLRLTVLNGWNQEMLLLLLSSPERTNGVEVRVLS